MVKEGLGVDWSGWWRKFLSGDFLLWMICLIMKESLKVSNVCIK